MNNKKTLTDKRKSPFLAFTLFFSAFILAAASAYGFSTYQKKQAERSNQSQLEQIHKQQTLLLKQPDVIDTNWLRTLNPLIEDVQGRLLWSSKQQIGLVLFDDLPSLKDNQKYHLYVYDLEGKNKTPISAAEFKPSSSGQFEKVFKPEVLIHKPLKFELILEEEGVELGTPLLLAQP